MSTFPKWIFRFDTKNLENPKEFCKRAKLKDFGYLAFRITIKLEYPDSVLLA